MFDAPPLTPQEQLKAWRRVNGYTMQKAAAVLEMGSASAYAYYESDAFKGDRLPVKMLRVIAPDDPDVNKSEQLKQRFATESKLRAALHVIANIDANRDLKLSADDLLAVAKSVARAALNQSNT